MKKYLLPLLLLFMAAYKPANAQQFLQDSTHVSGSDTDLVYTNEVDAFIYFRNNTADTIKLGWKMFSDTVPSAWSIGVCDNDQCYYNDNNELLNANKTSEPIAPGDTMDFKTEFIPNCLSGNGSVSLSVHVVGVLTPPDTITFTTNINAACAAVINLSNLLNPLKLFPNPVTNNVTIQGLAVNYHALQIDMLGIEGQVLQTSRKTNNGQIILDCENLPAGIYLTRITDLQDGSVSIGKFSKL